MANSIARLEKAFRRNPDSPLFARLADLYLDRGQSQRALAICEEGCAHFPKYSTGFIILSKCYEQQDDIERAREAMGHALRLDPENPGGYKRLSHLFQQLGVAPLALQSLQQAAYLDPFDEELEERLDQLSYEARKSASDENQRAEVEPQSAQETSPTETLLIDKPQNDPDSEVNEPFAQVQTQPEWESSPGVDEALKDFEQTPDAPVEKEMEATEPAAQPELGPTESPDATSPAASPGERDHDDAVAALGMEIFGGQIPSAADSTDAPVDTPTGSVQPPATKPSGNEAEKPQTAATAQREDRIRFPAEGTDAEDSTSDEISIFSPDILPADSEVFKPQGSTDSADPPGTEPPATKTPLPELPLQESTSESEAATTNQTKEPSREDTDPGIAEGEERVQAPTPEELIAGSGPVNSEPFLFGAGADTAELGEESDADSALDAPATPDIAGGNDNPFFFSPLEDKPNAQGEDSSGSESGPAIETPFVADPPLQDQKSTTKPIPPISPSTSSDIEQTSTESTSTTDLAAQAQTALLNESPAETAASMASESEAEEDVPADISGKSNSELLRLFQEIEQEEPIEPEPEPEPEQSTPTEPKLDHPGDKLIATVTLAEIYTIQGLTKKAIETYRELLAQDPDNTIIRSKLDSLEKNNDGQ